HLRVAFIFSGYGRPRHLHSFPTRRSSDLIAARRNRTTSAASWNEASGTAARCWDSGPLRSDRGSFRAWLPARGRVGSADRDQVRSEEHTSELQSRENLVCRLLLEKKKIKE